jgi:hypothetical protein
MQEVNMKRVKLTHPNKALAGLEIKVLKHSDNYNIFGEKKVYVALRKDKRTQLWLSVKEIEDKPKN